MFLTILVLLNIRGTGKVYGVRWALGPEYRKGSRLPLAPAFLAEPNELDR